MAFGTGTHESTQLCLEVLERLPLTGRTVLDIGTGSGILAIASAKLGAESVLACDIDPEAIQVAEGQLLPQSGRSADPPVHRRSRGSLRERIRRNPGQPGGQPDSAETERLRPTPQSAGLPHSLGIVGTGCNGPMPVGKRSGPSADAAARSRQGGMAVPGVSRETRRPA